MAAEARAGGSNMTDAGQGVRKEGWMQPRLLANRSPRACAQGGDLQARRAAPTAMRAEVGSRGAPVAVKSCRGCACSLGRGAASRARGGMPKVRGGKGGVARCVMLNAWGRAGGLHQGLGVTLAARESSV